MQLSVVVPTLNGRERLARTLDALASEVPDAEVIVVNGPSADGTTGMVRDREVVDVLVEIADRTVNAARNAGIERASGDVVALVNHGLAVDEHWRAALADGLADADVVTGPTHERLRAGMTTETVESRTIAGRAVTYVNGGNAAFRRRVLDECDGFDEYMAIGGARDLAHRLASMDYDVDWRPGMAVQREFEADGGIRETDWDWKYRSLAYRLAKNYGVRPTVLWRLTSHAGRDAVETLREVVRGDAEPSKWIGTGRTVLENIAVGLKDGTSARNVDRTPRRNPNGVSTRSDRAVEVYDWR
ncbi:MAG: glycosyltransferase family 2 protein [Haloarculaceae archaeon]